MGLDYGHGNERHFNHQLIGVPDQPYLIPHQAETYTLNVNGCSTSSDYILAITENEVFDVRSINVFPNPLKDVLTIELPESLNDVVSISIIDQAGAKIFNKDVSRVEPQKIFQLDFTPYRSGAYILQIGRRSANIEFKIIKE